MSSLADGRRERKKRQTREALRDHALRLFRERGFAATTVEQIADAADVSPRTVFRYFATKEDLLLPDLDGLFAEVETTLRARPITEPPLVALQATALAVLGAHPGIPSLAGAGPGPAPLDLSPLDLAPNHPDIAGRLVTAFLALEDRLGVVLAERRLAADPCLDPEQARLAGTVDACLGVAATRAAARTLRARRADAPDRPVTRQGVLDLVRACFEIAIGAPR